MLRVAHSLESILDSFRGVAVVPVSAEAIHIALDTCDAIRTLLGSLTPTAQLSQSRRNCSSDWESRSKPRPPPDCRCAGGSFSQYGVAVRRDDHGLLAENGRRSRTDELRNCYLLRGLKTLSAAAQYRKYPGLEEPLAQQLQILKAAASTGVALGSEERAALGKAFLRFVPS